MFPSSGNDSFSVKHECNGNSLGLTDERSMSIASVLSVGSWVSGQHSFVLSSYELFDKQEAVHSKSLLFYLPLPNLQFLSHKS